MKEKSLKNNEQIIINLVGVLLLLFISIPLFSPYLYRIGGGHDINFHLMRIEGLAEGLRMGQFPVKIQPAWYEGYGYGCSVFYGDVFLYIPALLRLLGLPLQWAYKFYVVMIQVGTMALSVYSFGHIFKDKMVAWVGTVLYALAVYRLMNIFVRGAVGEYTAMAFLPLIAYALTLLLGKNNNKQELNKGSLLLALAMTGILQSHILSAEMVCIILALICVIYIKRIFTHQVFTAFVKAVCLALLLNIGFLVPFVDYMLTGKFNVNAINGGWRVEQNIQEYGAFWTQLAQMFYSAEGGNLPRSMGIEGEMPIGLGFGLILAFAFFVVVAIKLDNNEKQQFQWKLAKTACFVAAVSMFMSTYYFPWEVLRKSNVLIRYIVINLQFPWRFCTIASVALVILWCCILQILWTKWNKRVIAAIGGGVIALSMLTAGYFMVDVIREGNAFSAVFAEDMDTNVESGEEYLPVNANSDDFKEENLYKGEGLNITGWKRKGISVCFECINEIEREQIMEVPLIYYKGYTAIGRYADASKIILSCVAGNNQVVRIMVPAKFSGNIVVTFKEPWYWRLSELIALLTALCVVRRIRNDIRLVNK